MPNRSGISPTIDWSVKGPGAILTVMKRHSSWALALAGGLILVPAAAGIGRADNMHPPRKTVVELFTSQGCSSCPPADALLRELSKRPDIIALSIHVNYWDYIGWKDPFASDETTARQHLYAAALHQRYVYTPEMVIDGAHDVTGSLEADVKTLIDEAAKRDRPRLAVAAKMSGKKIVVDLPAGDAKEKATVWLLTIDREHVTHVERGENTGRTLTDANVVRDVKKLGEWNGKPLQLTADMGDEDDENYVACAILVQSGEIGPVIGAAVVSMQ